MQKNPREGDDGKRRMCRSADVAMGKRQMLMRRTSAFYLSYCLWTNVIVVHCRESSSYKPVISAGHCHAFCCQLTCRRCTSSCIFACRHHRICCRCAFPYINFHSIYPKAKRRFCENSRKKAVDYGYLLWIFDLKCVRFSRVR